MHGLGVFACRKRAWPGLNPRLRGFGGEEGYLHETVRRRGGRVLCHPRLTWVHRFSRPLGIPYPNRWEDRIRNYLVSWGELGWDVAPMEAHYLELLGSQFDVPAVIAQARAQVEHPLGVFDAVFCLADGPAGADAHEHPPAIAWRVERRSLGAALDGEPRRLAAWHDALTTAAARGYEHVLLLDDEAGPDTLPGIDDADGSGHGTCACWRRRARPAFRHRRASRPRAAWRWPASRSPCIAGHSTGSGRTSAATKPHGRRSSRRGRISIRTCCAA